MDFSSEIGKNRSNTGGILRIFAYFRRKIGDSYGGHELISVSLRKGERKQFSVSVERTNR
jgi:hypothetical protein